MNFDYQHSLSDEDAWDRLQALGEYLQNRHGIHASVEGEVIRFSGKYMVVDVEGEMSMAPGVIRFSGKDPGFLWRKKATAYIQGKLEKYFDPNTPVTALPRK